jgi:hypothetical protein
MMNFMELLRNRRLLIIVAGSVVVLTILAVIALARGGSDKSDFIQEVPNLPLEQGLRIIEVEEENGSTLVTNRYDGYSLVVPATWFVPERASLPGGLSMFFSESGAVTNPPMEFHEGGQAVIRVIENPGQKSARDWLLAEGIAMYFPLSEFGNFQIASGGTEESRVYKISESVIDIDIDPSGFPLPEALRTSYVLANGTTIIVATCNVRGEALAILTTQCATALETITFLP